VLTVDDEAQQSAAVELLADPNLTFC